MFRVNQVMRREVSRGALVRNVEIPLVFFTQLHPCQSNVSLVSACTTSVEKCATVHEISENAQYYESVEEIQCTVLIATFVGFAQSEGTG